MTVNKKVYMRLFEELHTWLTNSEHEYYFFQKMKPESKASRLNCPYLLDFYNLRDH